MLTTPKDPPRSASSAVGTRSSPAPDEPDQALETARLRHEVALLTLRREIEEARAATASLAQVIPQGERTSPSTADVGTVAFWVAHQQLGDAVEAIGERVAHALGVVSKAERVSMSEAVTDALVKSARDHLDRAAAAEISGMHRTALERACMAALDRQAQLSIDEARRRNSLQDETERDARPDHGGPGTAPAGTAPAGTTQADDEEPSTSRAIRILVTDDPQVTASAWRAQHLTAQVAAHEAVLQRLNEQTASAGRDLETSLDCWVRGAPPDNATQPSGNGSSAGGSAGDRSSDGGELTPEQQWRAQAGIAEAAAATASGGKILAGTGPGQVVGGGPGGAGAEAAQTAVSPLTLSLQLLELARSDLTVSHRTVSVGAHELVVRGAASLATNLGSQGTVIADELTALDPAESHLMTTLKSLLQQRAHLASSAAALAGTVSFARSLAGLDDVSTDVATRQGGAPRQDHARTPPVVAPGLRELARQALLHERLVAHVVESLSTFDRDLSTWVQPGVHGGASPLLAAIGRERLHAGTSRFTHVLVLQDEGLTADVVSRHSIVGDSGRLTHIGSASVSWLLIDVASGAVVEGGQSAPARTLVQDTGSGRTSSLSMNVHRSASLPWDAQHTLELALKFFAVTAGLAALILSVVALVTVFLS